METPSRHACPQTDKQKVERERKMVACGKERGMNGNMHGDAREKRGVEEKAEVEMIWTKNGAARC